MVRQFKKLTFLSVFCTLLFGVNKATAQQPQYSQAEIDNMILTYSFYVVQDISMRVLAVKYPDLEKYVNNVTDEWQREFSSSIAEIDSQLYIAMADKWVAEKKQLVYKFEGTDYSTISKVDAKKFIDLVFQRSMGKIQSPIIETLLIFKPEYVKNPENEISDGYVNEYTSRPPRQPKEINIKIVYPRSWKSFSGNTKSNLYQKFISDNGFGSLELQFFIEKNRKIIAQDAINGLLSRKSLAKAVSDTLNIISYNTNGYIDNSPSATICYYREITELDKKKSQICEEYHSYYLNYHIKLEFIYTDSQNNKELSIESYERNRKLVRKIVNNVVILSQWEKKRF